jgi:hypothetical protein
MGLRQRLSTSFALSPDADKIATNESNASGLKFPFADRRATTVFNPMPATVRPLSAESGLLSIAQDGRDDAGGCGDREAPQSPRKDFHRARRR